MIVLAQRGWQAFSGLCTLYLVTRFLSLDDQGYYYTITTLVGILLALDLGLTNILVPFAAKHGSAEGRNPAALHGIGRYAAKWFFITGLCMLPIIPLGGLFLGLHNGRAEDLAPTWTLVVLATAANYMISPYALLVEGSGNTLEVYGNRMALGVCSSLVMWIVLYFGGGLVAIAIPPLIGFFYTGFWLLLLHRELLRKIAFELQVQTGWRAVVWPLQWRTGLNFFSGYLLVFSYTPMAFVIFGPKEAGQIGVTMAAVNTIYILSISGLVSKLPLLTQLASNGKRDDLAHTYKDELKKASVLYAILSFGLVLSLFFFKANAITERFLDTLQTLCIVVAMFFYMKASAHGYLMRAHLVDYALRFNLISLGCVIFIGSFASSAIGLWGIPLSMLLIFSLVLAPSMSSITKRLA